MPHSLHPIERAVSIDERDRFSERQGTGKPYRFEDHELNSARHGIIGASAPMQSVLEQVTIVAPTDSTVLIQGRQVPAKR